MSARALATVALPAHRAASARFGARPCRPWLAFGGIAPALRGGAMSMIAR
jgi:hypothetical protein